MDLDNAYLAAAGIGMIIVGAVGIIAFALFSLGAVVRFEVLPRVAPALARLASGTHGWGTPDVRRDVALARITDRPRR